MKKSIGDILRNDLIQNPTRHLLSLAVPLDPIILKMLRLALAKKLGNKSAHLAIFVAISIISKHNSKMSRVFASY